MKYLLAFFIALLSMNFAVAKCNNTGNRKKFSHDVTVTRYFFVFKNTDCFFVPGFTGGGKHIKSEIIKYPKHGQAGVNDHRIMYLPNNGFTGEDSATFKVLYKNTKGEIGHTLVNMTYTVK